MFTLMILIMVHGMMAKIHVDRGDYLAWVDNALTTKILTKIGCEDFT